MSRINTNALTRVNKVAETTSEKANVVSVKMIDEIKLVDYPENGEDINHTEDLETSIKELGFTDPIEVTEVEKDKYMIVSGHRRRAAAKKCGIKKIPCIIKKFKSDSDIKNYVLLANSQRDSSKDPLLYANRYLMHEQYLRSIGFKGSVREEIASRLGISVQQADRYKQVNSLIDDIRNMIKENRVGMSSVIAISSFDEDDQIAIYEMMLSAEEKDGKLTRDICKKIIDGYKAGTREYDEIEEKKVPHREDFGNNIVNYDDSLLKVEETPSYDDSDDSPLRNEEINYDYSHRDGLYEEDEYKDERPTEDDFKAAEKKMKNDEVDEMLMTGAKINSSVHKLESLLTEDYVFDSNEQAKEAMIGMKNLVLTICSELKVLEYTWEDIDFNFEIDDLKDIF